ncbi:hypothetical protein WSM22_12520 [Cytophagales bacterium WSM2-2]|nr:hypothetical protein WSM22_12520 [Cytophagales bacterium WSM2-2]
MNKNLLVFTVSLIVTTVAIGFGTMQFIVPSFLVLILGSLAVATWLVYYFVLKTKPENFIKNYLLTVVLKLIVGGIFIFILLFRDPAGANDNAILFMGAYLMLTVLEVGFLFKKFGQL